LGKEEMVNRPSIKVSFHQAHLLALIMGFPSSLQIDLGHRGKKIEKSEGEDIE